MMFATKIVLAVAAMLAMSEVVEGKRKHRSHHRRHHHKKERLPDAVDRHCADGQATLIVDGMSSEYTSCE